MKNQLFQVLKITSFLLMGCLLLFVGEYSFYKLTGEDLLYQKIGYGDYYLGMGEWQIGGGHKHKSKITNLDVLKMNDCILYFDEQQRLRRIHVYLNLGEHIKFNELKKEIERYEAKKNIGEYPAGNIIENIKCQYGKPDYMEKLTVEDGEPKTICAWNMKNLKISLVVAGESTPLGYSEMPGPPQGFIIDDDNYQPILIVEDVRFGFEKMYKSRIKVIKTNN